jgi:hypothetical protein
MAKTTTRNLLSPCCPGARLTQVSMTKHSGNVRITGHYKGTCEFCLKVREVTRKTNASVALGPLSDGVIPVFNYWPYKLFVRGGLGEFDIGSVHFECYEVDGMVYAKPDRPLPASWLVDLSADVEVGQLELV